MCSLQEAAMCVRLVPSKGLYGFLALLLFVIFGALHTIQRWVSPTDHEILQAAVIKAYRRQVEDLQEILAGQAIGDSPPAVSKRKLLLSDAWTANRQQPEPRMSPTLKRMPLVSDSEVFANRPKKAPTFPVLYEQLYGAAYSDDDNVVMSFTNPYGLTAHMDYPHSSMWLEGDKVMDRVFAELGRDGIKFIVEAGSMHGGSAIRMAIELDKRGLRDVPILCIDPWTGDLNMWLNRVVWEHLNVKDGRATTYDQFMVNVQKAITDKSIAPHHITPFPVSSVIGARWLQATGFTPQLIYLDSAHEVDETYYELCLYYNLLEPGGILMGDDYGWEAVRLDVDRFIKDKNLKLNMFGVYMNWFVKKPMSAAVV